MQLIFGEQLGVCSLPPAAAVSAFSGQPDASTTARDARTVLEYYTSLKTAMPSKTRFVAQDWRRVPAKPLFRTALKSAPADVDSMIRINEQPTPLEAQYNTKWRGMCVPGGLVSNVGLPVVFATQKQKDQFREQYMRQHTIANCFHGAEMTRQLQV